MRHEEKGCRKVALLRMEKFRFLQMTTRSFFGTMVIKAKHHIQGRKTEEP
jgi:hypothetical protein